MSAMLKMSLNMRECWIRPIRLSEDQYIVIGDNIVESKDNRYELVGIVEEDGIIGEVIERN